MTEVLTPVLVPYTRFLEVRARRLAIVAELVQPVPQAPDDGVAAAVAAAPPQLPNDERAHVDGGQKRADVLTDHARGSLPS